MPPLIELKDVSFSYSTGNGSVEALSGLNLSIDDGSFVAIVGSNGSGKSTFAKLLNALIVPSSGSVVVDGLDSHDKSNVYAIRSKVGLVFQNPDNQIVSDTVEDDIAFGLENMGLGVDEMKRRLEVCLSLTGLATLRHCSPDMLSGGQKQLVAIAGILAMQPKCVVLDEATAMLDPNGRRMVLGLCHRLNHEVGMTVVLITHHMEECIDADRVVVFDKGHLAMDGTPREVFSNAPLTRSLGFKLPPVTELSEHLISSGIDIPHGILTSEELCNALKAAYAKDVHAKEDHAKDVHAKEVHAKEVHAKGSSAKVVHDV